MEERLQVRGTQETHQLFGLSQRRSPLLFIQRQDDQGVEFIQNPQNTCVGAFDAQGSVQDDGRPKWAASGCRLEDSHPDFSIVGLPPHTPPLYASNFL